MLRKEDENIEETSSEDDEEEEGADTSLAEKGASSKPTRLAGKSRSLRVTSGGGIKLDSGAARLSGQTAN